MLWRNTVQRENDAKPIGFDPQVRQVQAGDSVFWLNEDTHAEHQPFPAGGSQTAWFAEPIPPQASSDQIRFSSAGSVSYACAIHPGETGTIDVAAIVQIGPTFEGGVGFAPQALSLKKGQSAVWNNCDDKAHWPMPQGGPEDAWLQHEIEPGDTSPPVAFNEVTPPAGTPYVCALHSGETGTIKVT
jgi:plastocyanin